MLKRYNRCCLCRMENRALLTASHIKPWVESEPKEKLDVNNGFLMCPNHDRLFLNVNSKMHIEFELTESNKRYLEFHRENVFDK